MKHFLLSLLLLLSSVSVLRSQVIYVVPSGNTLGLFQVNNGAVTRLPTGFSEHNFPSVSRDSQFVVFSSPDPVTPALQIPPSSDVYIYDRVFNRTRRAVNFTSRVEAVDEVVSFRPVSAALSPNNQLLAYGWEITRRQGIANPQSGRVLTVANAGNGLAISSPTDARGGAMGDSTGSEFVGLSWDPAGTSFVTPFLVPAGGASLPAIVRVSQTGPAQWSAVAQLSTSSLTPPSANVQIYPAISPSGAGLAYFNVQFPDVLTSSVGVIATLVVANADGSGATALGSFPQGLYPAGLAWSRDGTHLIYSVAAQLQLGGAFLTSIDPNNSAAGAIRISDGTAFQIAGIGDGSAIFPSVPESALLPRDTTRPGIKVRGGKRIRTNRANVVIKGKARDNLAVARVDAKARGAKVRRVRLQGGNRFKVIVRMQRPRAVVRLTTIDRAGLKSKKQTIRISRR